MSLHVPLSFPLGRPHPISPQPTHLLTLLPGHPGLPVHGSDKLESQFVEQGTLGAVLPIKEWKDGLFRGLVILFHIIGQVAGERHQITGQEHDRNDLLLELSFPERTQAAHYPVSQSATLSSRRHGWAETSPTLKMKTELNGKPEGIPCPVFQSPHGPPSLQLVCAHTCVPVEQGHTQLLQGGADSALFLWSWLR